MQKRLLESRGQYLKLHLDVAVYLPPVLLLLILRVGGVNDPRGPGALRDLRSASAGAWFWEALLERLRGDARQVRPLDVVPAPYVARRT